MRDTTDTSTRRDLTSSDFSTLSNVCRVAATRFAEHATMWRQMAEQPPAPASALSLMPTGPAALRLAEQFTRQEREALEFAKLFDAAEEGHIRAESDDPKEDDQG